MRTRTEGAATVGWFARVSTLGCIVLLAVACDRPDAGAEAPDPCASGPTLEALALPVAYTVKVGEATLGELELPAEGPPRLVAAADAPAASVTAFEALLGAANGAPAVEYGWSKRTAEGETYGCTDAVPKGDPSYASALARHLEGKRVEGGIVALSRE